MSATATDNGNRKQVQFQMDTGATCNILSLQTLKTILTPEQITSSLMPSPVTLNMYNNQRTKPVGTVTLSCKKDRTVKKLNFVVVNGNEFANKPPLLSGSSCIELGIIKIKADEIHAVETKQDCTQNRNNNDTLQLKNLQKQYHDVFKGLGQIGEPASIKLNPDIRPKQLGIRRYPINKVDKISQRINEMIEEGKLVKVTEPTPWRCL